MAATRLRTALLLAALAAGAVSLGGCATLGGSGLLGQGAVTQTATWDPASGQMVEATQVNRKRLFHYGWTRRLASERVAWRLGELEGASKASAHALARKVTGPGKPTISNPSPEMLGDGINAVYGH